MNYYNRNLEQTLTGITEEYNDNYGIWDNLVSIYQKHLIADHRILFRFDKEGHYYSSYTELISDLEKVLKEKLCLIDEVVNACIFKFNYGFIYVIKRTDNSFSVCFCTEKEGLYRHYLLEINKLLTKEAVEGNHVNVVSSSPKGLSLVELGCVNEPLVEDNYSPDVVNSFHYIINEYKSKNPFGRFVILDGNPGAGKSFYVRSLISELKNLKVILMPVNLVGELDGPSLISMLLEQKNDNEYYGPPELDENGMEVDRSNKPILLILEDADACLVPRGSDNISVISSLLNCTDGIFGSLIDLRVIATTNAKKINFDTALTRPGRLCRNVHFDDLDPKQASKIYKRLTGVDRKYDVPTSLATVYSDAKEKENSYKEKKVKSVGFGF